MAYVSKMGGSKGGGKKFGGNPAWKRQGNGGASKSPRGASGRSFGTGGGFNSGFDKPELFEATCATCGKDCKVPFKPNGRKPVLCSACFENDGPSESRRPLDKRSEGSGDRASSSGDAQMLKTINAKLDAILAMLNDL